MLERPGNVFEHINKHARSNGDYDDYQPLGPPAEPTREIPGTPERVEVYCQRIMRGEELFHDEDYVLTENIDADLRELWRRTSLNWSVRRSRHYGE
jgi:hypothetical protein